MGAPPAVTVPCTAPDSSPRSRKISAVIDARSAPGTTWRSYRALPPGGTVSAPEGGASGRSGPAYSNSELDPCNVPVTPEVDRLWLRSEPSPGTSA